MSIALLTVLFGIISVFNGGTGAKVLAQDTTSSSSSSIEQIKVTREISAPLDKVWNIVSDVDNDPKYYDAVQSVKNINKTGNVIEREVVSGPQGATSLQIVVLNPKQSVVINTTDTEAPLTANSLRTLTPLSENKTRVDITWNTDMSNIPIFAEDNFMKTTILGL